MKTTTSMLMLALLLATTASAEVTPHSLDFGDVIAGEGSPGRRRFVVISSKTTETLSSVEVSPPFRLIGTNCGYSTTGSRVFVDRLGVAPGHTCYLEIDFLPFEPGAVNGTLKIKLGKGIETVKLSGRAIGRTPAP